MDDKPEHSLNIEDLTQGQQTTAEGPVEVGQNPAPHYIPPASPFIVPRGMEQPAQPLTSVPTVNLHPEQPAAQQASAALPPVDISVAAPLPSATPAAPPAEPIVQSRGDTKDAVKNLAQQHRHRLRPVGYAMGAFALFLIVFNFQLIAQQIGYFLHPPKPAENLTLQDPNALTTNAQIVPPESLIIIPKINVSAPIVYADSVDEAAVLKDLESGVVHYANTAKPGENGNAVIFGHSSNDWWESGNYKFVFALLNKLEPGDQVQINYSSRKYVYEVTEKKVVAPTEVSVLNQTPTPILTLITCTPPGTAWQRLIVTAKQIQPVPSAKPAEQIAASQNPAAQAPQKTTQKPLPGNAPSIGDQLQDIWKNVVAFFTPKPQQDQQQAPQQQGTPRLPDVS